MARLRRRSARASALSLACWRSLAIGAGPARAADAPEAPARRPPRPPGAGRRPGRAHGARSGASTPTARAASWSPPRTTRPSASGPPRTAASCAPCACRPGPATSARPTPPRSAPTAPSSPPAGGPAHRRRSESVYLFDRASGRLLRRVGGLPDVVLHLAFSPDGTRLAAALGSRRRAADRPRHGPGRGGGPGLRRPELRGRVRPASGRLATTSFDGKVRLYDPGLRLLRGRAPRRAASGPSGSPSRPTAAGSRSATTTAPRSTCSTGRRCERLFAARHRRAWTTATSTAGRLVGGRRQPLRRRAVAGRRRVPPAPLARGRAGRAGRPAAEPEHGHEPARRCRAGGSPSPPHDPRLGVLGADGREAWSVGPATADFRGQRAVLAVSADGARVRFGYEHVGQVAGAVLAGRAAARAGRARPTGLATARTAAPGLAVEGWKDSTEPTLNGERLALERLRDRPQPRHRPGRAALRAGHRLVAAPVRSAGDGGSCGGGPCRAWSGR